MASTSPPKRQEMADQVIATTSDQRMSSSASSSTAAFTASTGRSTMSTSEELLHVLLAHDPSTFSAPLRALNKSLRALSEYVNPHLRQMDVVLAGHCVSPRSTVSGGSNSSGGGPVCRYWDDEKRQVNVCRLVDLLSSSPGAWLTSTRRLVIHPALFARDLLATDASLQQQPTSTLAPPSHPVKTPSPTAAPAHRMPTALSPSRKQAHAHAHAVVGVRDGALSTVKENGSDLFVARSPETSAARQAAAADEEAQEEEEDHTIRREMDAVEALIDRFAGVGVGADFETATVAGLKSLSIASPYGLTNGVWKAISRLPQLVELESRAPTVHPAANPSRPVHFPRYTPFFLDHQSSSVEAENGVGLGLGLEPSTPEEDTPAPRRLFLSLETLKLENLSAVGTQNVALHLREMAIRDSSIRLRRLHISTVFFDQGLCEAIGGVASHGTLQELAIGTSGTKLLAGGLSELISFASGLKRLVLREVQGRLSKATWAEISSWPTSLQEVIIELNEVGQHHSWSADHLDSVSSLPLEQLKILKIQRMFAPISHLPFTPGMHVPEVDPMAIPKSIPNALMEAIVAGRLGQIEDLSLDWWDVGEDDFAKIMKSCPHVTRLKLKTAFPMLRLVALPTVTLTAPNLAHLTLSTAPEPDSYFEAGTHNTNKTAKLKALAKVEQAGGMTDALVNTLPPELKAQVLLADPSIPPIKELRKCLRKLPALDEIDWLGRHGRGSWKITRFDGKRCSCWGIDFQHAAWRYTGLWAEIKANNAPGWDFGHIALDDAIADAPADKAMGLESVQATPSLAHLSISSSESSLMTMVRQWSQSSSVGEFEELPPVIGSLESSPNISSGVHTTKKPAAPSGSYRTPKAASTPASPESSKSGSRSKSNHFDAPKSSSRKPVGERRRERKSAAESRSPPLGMAPRPSATKSEPIKAKSSDNDALSASPGQKTVSYARVVGDDGWQAVKDKGRRAN